MLSPDRGVTLLEVTVSAALAALIAGGTMTAFVTALNISRRTSSTDEAAHLAQQTIERFRNLTACDAGQWFSAAGCASSLPVGWQSDPVPPPPPGSVPMTRDYQVTEADCDGDGTSGDCLMVQTRVNWTPPS